MALRVFSRPLTWLVRGLQLNQPAELTKLQDDEVHPMLDVFQGGWGVAEYHTIIRTITGPAAGSTYTLFPTASGNPTIEGFTSLATDVTRLITSISIHNITVAAGISSTVLKQRAAGTTSLELVMSETGALAVGAVASWSELGGGAPYWVYEPGTSLIISAGAIAAAELYRMSVTWVEVPNGFKPF